MRDFGRIVPVAIAVLQMGLGLPAAAEDGRIKCKLTYNLKGWSAFYRSGIGDGRITCSNDQAVDVRIRTQGGGVTFGKFEVIGGKGTFSAVRDIRDLYGGYVEAGVHAGAGGSADARAMFKGNVNLSLAGTGEGVNLGFAFGSFRIEPK